jgi:hypothetical protein
MMQVSFGVDRILAQHPSWKNESLGLLTNHAATTRDGTPAREALLRHGLMRNRLIFAAAQNKHS